MCCFILFFLCIQIMQRYAFIFLEFFYDIINMLQLILQRRPRISTDLTSFSHSADIKLIKLLTFTNNITNINETFSYETLLR